MKRLDKFQAQLPNYGEVLSNVIFRNEKDREFLLEALSDYLEKNPDVKVLGISDIPDTPRPKWKFMIQIEFTCSNCKKRVRERTNLTCTWYPSRIETKPLCEYCSQDPDWDEPDYGDEAEEEPEEEIKGEYSLHSFSQDVNLKGNHEKEKT